ncbi:Ger(x)C family spore germination protein [Bacillus sp. REN10]|uniref:Ger(x)C family spore germination protein n=1 Tax=Bacillus sp. REN10 TaxID=2782541 RepID=UPI00193B67E9|nr:Ger(x)C family spore germination protein [Bacillus sp. REN10]
MKQCSILIICLLLILPLAGCWDANEPERMVYIEGLGVDYKNGEFIVYLQVINPGLLAKSESTSGISQSNVVVGRGKGKTVNEAVFDIYRSSQRRLFWGHLSFFIFTDKALKNKGLEATIDLFDRYRETRYGTYIFATKEPLFNIMTTLPPLKSSTVYSKLSTPEPSYKQSSFIKPVDMREALIALNEPPHQAVIPYVRLVRKTWKSDEKMKTAVQLDGVASITEKRLKDIIYYPKMRGLRWLNKDLKREEVSITVEEVDISLLVDKVKVKTKPVVKEENVHFNMSIDATILLREIPTDKSIKKIEKKAAKVLKQEILETYKEGLKTDSDLFRLSEVLYRDNVQAWKKIQHNGQVPLTTDSLTLDDIKVKAKIKGGERQRRRSTL